MSLLYKLSRKEPERVHALSGRLYLSNSDWLLLSVPNALVRSLHKILNEPGAELPNDGKPEAHISIMRAEEVKQLGGGDKIKERGQSFTYTLGPVMTVEPAGQSDKYSRVWFVEVDSPELRKLRKSYGLPGLPKHPFHITFAYRRRNVLYDNDVSKQASVYGFLEQINAAAATTRQREELQSASFALDALFKQAARTSASEAQRAEG